LPKTLTAKTAVKRYTRWAKRTLAFIARLAAAAAAESELMICFCSLFLKYLFIYFYDFCQVNYFNI